jgi:hypothetical protein
LDPYSLLLAGFEEVASSAILAEAAMGDKVREDRAEA